MVISDADAGSVFTASGNAGSTSLTISSNANITVGDSIVGTGIPENTFVAAVNSATAITISAATTASLGGVELILAASAKHYIE